MISARTARAVVGVVCALLVPLTLTGCAQPRRAGGPAVTPYPETLQGRLDNYEVQWRASVGPRRAKLQDEYTAGLRASEAAAQALQVGDQAPAFELPDTSDEPVALADLLSRGPVVLVWYRGGWSPWCTITLRAYAEAWPQIQELGATLVAISPQTVENSLLTQQLGQFEFDVLSDAGNRVARQYGLSHKLPPAVVADLRASADPRTRVELREYNGDASDELPLTATYVIDCDGVIRYAFVDPDYRKRAEPADVVALLKELQAGAAEQPGAVPQ